MTVSDTAVETMIANTSVIENSKLTVVGAGAVGSSVAYAALIRGSARHVALYDIAAEKTEAEVLDLAHGAQFTGSSDIIGGADISVAAGSHVVVITAGAKQRPGQTRLELAGVNANILKTMMPQMVISARKSDWCMGAVDDRGSPRSPSFAASMSTM